MIYDGGGFGLVGNATVALFQVFLDGSQMLCGCCCFLIQVEKLLMIGKIEQIIFIIQLFQLE